MREILFRGKRFDNREWVEGFLLVGTDCIYPGRAFICKKMYAAFCDSDEDDLMLGGFVEVDPATVGQYTGLQDKNGKWIFEGDILRIAKKMEELGGYYFPPLKCPVNVVVKWDFCAWMWETLCEDKRYISFPKAWCQYECEIIGNIHDNPELLGGAE